MLNNLIDFLKSSFTAYHAASNIEKILLSRGFTPLCEREDWEITSGGKYFVTRGGSSVVAFTVGNLEEFSYKLAATHLDSPALKLKENPLVKGSLYATLNVETYGGGVWYSFFDRPLKIAGRVIVEEEGKLKARNVVSPFTLTIPSVAIHQNRGVNEGFAVNPQIDLKPLLCGADEIKSNGELIEKIAGEGVLSYDLFLVNADIPYSFGLNDEFLAAPRIDDLVGAYAALESLSSGSEKNGICVAAFMDNEETGSLSPQGADGDFMEVVLRRIAYALRFDDNEYYKAIANSFLLSIDNAHAAHPNHPEKADETNKPKMGGGVVIKAHADKAYVTDALSSAIVKKLLSGRGIPYQSFFNRADVRSGSTLGKLAQRHIGVAGADIGIAQLAMHSALECFAKADYLSLVEGIAAYFERTLFIEKEGAVLK